MTIAAKNKSKKKKSGRTKIVTADGVHGVHGFIRHLPEILHQHKDGNYSEDEARLARYWFLKGYAAASECFGKAQMLMYENITGDIDPALKFLRGEYGKNLGATPNGKPKAKAKK